MMTTLVKLSLVKQYAEQITIKTYRSTLTVVTQNVPLLIIVHVNKM